jgi:hypothetical protein
MFKLHTVLKRPIVVIMLLLMGVFVVQLVYNLSRGYVLLAPLDVNELTTKKVFQSKLKPISIDYPARWAAFDLPQGDGRDQEAIAVISPVSRNYPYIQIAYQEMQNDSLEAVEAWGEQRIMNPVRDITRTFYETDSLDNIEIDAQKALIRKYHYLDYASKRMNCIHTYLLHNQAGYIVEMCVNEENDSPELRGLWEEMIQSISLQ